MTTPTIRSEAAGGAGSVVLTQSVRGYPVIPDPTPLTRLNFFDGRLLRGEDLLREQTGQRELTFAVGRAGGSGVVYGLDVLRAGRGDVITVGAGLAIDPRGRPLLLPQDVTVSVPELLAASRGETRAAGPAAPAGTATFGVCEVVAGEPVVQPVSGTEIYVLTAAHVEGACGHAEVFGHSCSEVCITSSQRPNRVDGVVLRLHPVPLTLPGAGGVALDDTHMRSRVAAAYFAASRDALGPPLSAASLAALAWCRGATGPAGTEVPLAILVRRAGTTVLVDAWTARRERVDPPPQSYWDGRMNRRPASLILAEVNQFQCQLSDLLRGTPRLTVAESSGSALVNAGIVELPPLGYLPTLGVPDVVKLVEALMGDSVRPRYVPVPADQVAYEVTVGEHRKRISLLAGIADPGAKSAIDILVPDGTFADEAAMTGNLYLATAKLGVSARERDEVSFSGAVRLSRRGGGFTVVAAGVSGVSSQQGALDLVEALGGRPSPDRPFRTVARPATGPVLLSRLRSVAADAGAFAARGRAARAEQPFTTRFGRDEAKLVAVRVSAAMERDPFALGGDETTFATLDVDLYTPAGASATTRCRFIGTVRPLDGAAGADSRRFRITGHVTMYLRPRSGEVVERVHAVVLNIGAERSAGAGDHVVTLRVGDHAEPITVRLAPLQIDASAGGRLTASLRAVPPGSAEAQQARDWGDSALKLLRGAYPTDADFYPAASRELFGTAEGETLRRVTTPYDWIAFRSGVARPVEPPAAPGAVLVWTVTADGPGQAAGMAKLVRRGEADEIEGWRRVQTVLFDAGTDQPVTSASELRDSYRQQDGPPLLRLVGYAALPGAPVSAERAERILRMLDPEATLDSTGLVDAVPPALLETDVDGVVLLVGYQPVPAVRVEVLALNTDAQKEFQVLNKMIDSGNFDSVQRMIVGEPSKGSLYSAGTVRLHDGRPVDDGELDDLVARLEPVLHRRSNRGTISPFFYYPEEWAADHADQIDPMREFVVTTLRDRLVDGETVDFGWNEGEIQDDRRRPLNQKPRDVWLFILHAER